MVVAVQLMLLAAPGAARAQEPPAPAVTAGCAAATTVPTDDTMRAAATMAVLCLVNDERTQRWLRPVAGSAPLNRAAASHSADMVRKKYFSHVSPTGVSMRRRVALTGYLRGRRRVLVAEAIAWGNDVFASPAELVRGLMASPRHRAIVLDRRFRDIGIGLALGAPLRGMGSGSTLALSFGRR